MNLVEFSGLSDSPASVACALQPCTRCNTTTNLQSGICLQCLFEGALVDDGTAETALFDLLAELELKQTKWRIHDYEILDEIGRGGMGVIYRARETPTGRIVALKRILTYHADSDQTLARFRREAETATRLDHPNIVPIYHVAQDEEGLPFFSMKFAAGGSLAKAGESFRRDPRKIVSIMSKVAFAVQYAHERGVLHRDLKPSNILLDSRWEPLVSDFGLAKWIADTTDITRTLTVFGTAGYIAPEQATRPGMRVTTAADVYNLGAITFELLTGRSPFVGEHALAVLQQALAKPAPRLRSFAPHVDRDLETICARCLEREPSARYSSAGAIGRDLQKWLEGRPITARPVPIPMRVWRWCQRNRTLAATLGALAVVTTAAIPLGIHDDRLRKAEREASLTQRSVAVLPLFDVDKVVWDETSTPLIADSLKQRLNRFSPSTIKGSRLAVFAGLPISDQIRKVGQAERTRSVFTGTTRSLRGKQRASLQLMDAVTGEPLLVRTYESSRLELKEIIDQNAGAEIDRILNTKDWSGLLESTIDPGLTDQASREAMAAGRQLVFRYNDTDFQKGLELLKKAVRMQPASSIAHSNLAMAATVRTHFAANPDLLRVGEAEALQALRLSPNSSQAHIALAGVLYQQGKFSDALEEGLRTVESVGPEERSARFIGMTLDTLGRPDKALKWHSLAGALGASSSDEYSLVGDCWAKLGDDEKAAKFYNRELELQPDSSLARVGLCHLLMIQGDFEAARAIYRNTNWNQHGLGDAQQIAGQIEFFRRRFEVAERLYTDLLNKDEKGGGSFYGAVSYESALGRAKQALGDKINAEKLLQHALNIETATLAVTPTNPEVLYRLAAVESSLAMSQSAIAHLAKAIDSGWIDHRSLALDPRFDGIRGDSQFKMIFQKLESKVADMKLNSEH